VTFTRDELIAALEDAQPTRGETPNSVTVPELSRRLGVTQPEARERIRAAIEEGVMRPERVWRLTMAGHLQRVVGYVLVAGQGKAPEVESGAA
jgi:DNA-binding Lrp family transcriptional regulator